MLKRSWCAGGCCGKHETTAQGHLNQLNSMAGLCREERGWPMKGSDCHLLCNDEASPGALCPFFVTPALFKSDLGKLEIVQQRGMLRQSGHGACSLQGEVGEVVLV